MVYAKINPKTLTHDDVIKWKHFPRYWPSVRRIHRSSVNSPHKGQWRGALMFSFMCARINSWVNNREAGDLRRYRHHYDVIVMWNKWLSIDTYIPAYVCYFPMLHVDGYLGDSFVIISVIFLTSTQEVSSERHFNTVKQTVWKYYLHF